MSDEFLVRTVRLPSTSNVAVCVSSDGGSTWKYFLRNNYKSMARAKADAQEYIAHQSRFHDQNDG